MKIKTTELQKAYDNWYSMKLSSDPSLFWELLQAGPTEEKHYNVQTDEWELKPESLTLAKLLASPYYQALYKAWKIKNG